MAYDLTTPSPGVLARHADRCPARTGGECTCGPLGYRAARGGRAAGPLVQTEGEARAWGREQLDPAGTRTLAASIADFLDAAATGRARDAGGRRFSTGAQRDLRWALEGHVADDLGDSQLADVRRHHLQELVDRLQLAGVSTARVESVVDALRALYRYALDERLVDFSPAEALIVGGQERSHGDHRPEVPAGMVPDHVIWMSLKIATVAFVLIALILVAESV